jgi:hypothetical protein
MPRAQRVILALLLFTALVTVITFPLAWVMPIRYGGVPDHENAGRFYLTNHGTDVEVSRGAYRAIEILMPIAWCSFMLSMVLVVILAKMESREKRLRTARLEEFKQLHEEHPHA